jgi:hypothetical protein
MVALCSIFQNPRTCYPPAQFLPIKHHRFHIPQACEENLPPSLIRFFSTNDFSNDFSHSSSMMFHSIYNCAFSKNQRWCMRLYYSYEKHNCWWNDISLSMRRWLTKCSSLFRLPKIVSLPKPRAKVVPCKDWPSCGLYSSGICTSQHFLESADFLLLRFIFYSGTSQHFPKSLLPSSAIFTNETSSIPHSTCLWRKFNTIVDTFSLNE